MRDGPGGWGVFLLPYQEQGALYDQLWVNRGQAVCDHPTGNQLALATSGGRDQPALQRTILSAYICPSATDPDLNYGRMWASNNYYGKSNYKGVCGVDWNGVNTTSGYAGMFRNIYVNGCARMRDVLDGFKEVKLSSSRRDALLRDMVRLSTEARDAKADMQVKSGNEFVFGQTMIFLLLGVVVFVVPSFGNTEPEAVVRTATAILFIVGPLSMVIQAVPMMAMANAAAENLMRMDRVLREIAAASEVAETPPQTLTSFEEIRLDGVAFTYAPVGGVSFGVGPVDLTIRAGELIFVTGGNGSGKSTLIRLLLGLYHADRGMIRLDGKPVTRGSFETYRSLFSAIYADYHLFRRLYGIEPPDAAEFEALVKLMEMGGKVALQGDLFDTIDLSSGQRKRLALMVSMIEDRPVLVLDEWAADQDPQFRRKFYRELLPMLKARGKTVIAITHDDRYFDVADRRVAMEEGRVVRIVDNRDARTEDHARIKDEDWEDPA